jgi:hypothetical protein
MARPLEKSLSSGDWPRLVAAFDASQRVLSGFRQNRTDAVRMYAGRRWTREAYDLPQPLNFLSLYVAVVGRALVPKDPRVMLSVRTAADRPAVAALQHHVNARADRVKLGRQFARVAEDALFCLGVMKVGLATPAEAAAAGYSSPAGAWYAKAVDLDDYVLDAHARDKDECAFEGHMVRVPLDAVRDDSKTYNAYRKQATASTDRPFTSQGDPTVSGVGREPNAEAEEYEEMTDLWEFYLPRDKLVVTFAAGTDGRPLGEPIRVAKYVGPPSGPYHHLAFSRVPGSVMPKAPIMDLVENHVAMNALYAKLVRQALRQKENMLYDGSAGEDAGRIRDAADGEAVRVDGLRDGKVAMTQRGGPNAANFQFVMDMQERLNFFAGNIKAVGGLDVGAKTLGQDQMLTAGATRTLADMQDTAVRAFADVFRAICWYDWHHPSLVIRRQAEFPDGRPFDAEVMAFQKDYAGPMPKYGVKRSADFDTLDVKVDPYSLQHQTPQSKLAATARFMSQFVLPALPAWQQQGYTVDLGKFAALYAELADLPDIPALVGTADPPPRPAGGDPGGGGMSPVSDRTYTRVSESGGDDGGGSKTQQAIAALDGVRQATGGTGVMNMKADY